MTEQFDPYHRWLGIRPEEQPADHYRLLALARFEDDVDVIRDAAEQRIRHVRSYQLGPHRKLSQKILNELAAAKACLLDARERAAYDERLRAEQCPAEEAPRAIDASEAGPSSTSVANATSRIPPAAPPAIRLANRNASQSPERAFADSPSPVRSRFAPGRIDVQSLEAIIVAAILLFVVPCVGWLLLGISRYLALLIWLGATVLIFVSVVLPLGQLFLFGGSRPKTASACVGAVLLTVLTALFSMTEGIIIDGHPPQTSLLLCAGLLAIPVGALLGFLLGAMNASAMHLFGISREVDGSEPRTHVLHSERRGRLVVAAVRFLLIIIAMVAFSLFLKAALGALERNLDSTGLRATPVDVLLALANVSMKLAVLSTGVSIGRKLLFHGERPRVASLCTGAILILFLLGLQVMVFLIVQDDRPIFDSFLSIVSAAIVAIPGGAVLGYVAGVFSGCVIRLFDRFGVTRAATLSSAEDVHHYRLCEHYYFNLETDVWSWFAKLRPVDGLKSLRMSLAGSRIKAYVIGGSIGGLLLIVGSIVLFLVLCQGGETEVPQGGGEEATADGSDATDAMGDSSDTDGDPEMAPEVNTATDPTIVTGPALAVAPFDEAQAKAHQEAWADHLELDVEMTNSIGMRLVLIPPGEYMMGSPESEDYRSESEFQHPVRITKPFCLGVTEVTQGQWEAVMGTQPWSGKRLAADGSDRAASYVSWEDAQAFCEALSKKEDATYRLPTEAEWEHACRAGSTTVYHFGDDASQLGEYASFRDAAAAEGVGQKKPNPFGLYDMHGSLWEWCQDWYGEDYYAGSPTDDPIGPDGGSLRVGRGGSWNLIAGYCRSASRLKDLPSNPSYLMGFRVARRPTGK